ncbi:MAG: hypothetical protein QXE20_00810 [Acidilobaceae archaeon]
MTDATLREGQQAWRPFSEKEAEEIYEVLVDLNGKSNAIKYTEIFLYSDKDRRIAKRLLDYGYENPAVRGWIRASKQDVRLLAESKLQETIMLTSISDYHIYYKLGLSREEALNSYLEAIEEAYRNGIVVECALEDVTRADPQTVRSFLERLTKLAERYRIEPKARLSDTLGLGLPFYEVSLPRSVPRLVELALDAGISPQGLGFHGHNDFGLSVANHLAAWFYGAMEANCTLLGIGERTGICPLELMLLHYVSLTGHSANLKAITKAAELLSKMGWKIPANQLLVGSKAFMQKSGIHIDGLLKNPLVYLPMDVEEVLGKRFEIEVTPYSGRSGIVYWLRNRIGITIDKNHPGLERAASFMREAFNGKEQLTDEELAAIVINFIPELTDIVCSKLDPKVLPQCSQRST